MRLYTAFNSLKELSETGFSSYAMQVFNFERINLKM